MSPARSGSPLGYDKLMRTFFVDYERPRSGQTMKNRRIIPAVLVISEKV
jgi:hypothetical protein